MIPHMWPDSAGVIVAAGSLLLVDQQIKIAERQRMASLLLTCLMLAGIGDQSYVTWTTETANEKELPATEGSRQTPNDLARLVDGKPALPYIDLTCGVRLNDGSLWIGSKRGLMHRTPQSARWRLFHSRRWLPSDDVQDVAVDAQGVTWARTSAGIVKIFRRETTLEDKMAQIEAELRANHIRDGIVGSISGEPGNSAAWTQPSNDNDGLWTSMYVAAEAFRFGATGDRSAKKYAWESLQALEFFEQITGIPGFVARSVYPAAEGFNANERFGGEWHLSADGKWWWKGDTSSDELDGHYFAYAVYYDIAATPEEKQRIASVVARITDHILDNDYHYVGATGKPTRWGVWAPEKLNQDLRWFGDRGLNSLEILSHLKVADHIVGGTKYALAAKQLIEQHSYAMNTVDQKRIWPAEMTNHSDDELAFLAYYPLLRYERDRELRQIYLAGLYRSWQIERPEHSPFFNYIYAACRQAGLLDDPSQRPDKPYLSPETYDHDVDIEWFREVPADLIEWTVRNSERHDLGEVHTNRFDEQRSRFVLPIAERHLTRWNGDPYQLDGGSNGNTRDDGTFILLPYWMGRYHRFIE